MRPSSHSHQIQGGKTHKDHDKDVSNGEFICDNADGGDNEYFVSTESHNQDQDGES